MNGGNVAVQFGPYYRSSQRSKEAEREALGMPALSPEAISGERYGELSAYLTDADKQKQIQIQQGYMGLAGQQVKMQKEAEKTKSLTSAISGGAAVAGTALAGYQALTPAATAAPALTSTSGATLATGALEAGAIPAEVAPGATTSTLPAAGAGFGGAIAEGAEAVGGAVAAGAEAVGSVFETIGTALLALFPTVICTELYRQKITSKRMLMADLKFGKWVIENDPYTYIGYHQWAPHVVRLMRKSKFFTKFVCIFALPWQKEMAYRVGFLKKGNLFGYVLMEMGVPVCRYIGKRVDVKKFVAKQAIPEMVW